MKVFSKEGKMYVTELSDYSETDKPIIITSQLFPLSGAPEVFHAGNTEDCKDKQLQQIFDSTEAALGYCYTNIENLAMNLKAAGIPKKRYKTYVGWLFPGDTLPVHHAFVVVDNKYMLDFTTNRKYADPDHLKELYIKYGDLSEEDLREALAIEFIEESSRPHSQRGTFGRVGINYVYIASQCKPSQGRVIYNRLIRAHPNHPCIRNTTPSGATDMQLRIMQKRNTL